MPWSGTPSPPRSLDVPQEFSEFLFAGRICHHNHDIPRLKEGIALWKDNFTLPHDGDNQSVLWEAGIR